jgi:uncharacterized protein (TIGR04551 family)
MRLIVFLSCSLIVLWSAVATAQDAQPSSPNTPAANTAAPEDAKVTPPSESAPAPEAKAPQEEKSPPPSASTGSSSDAEASKAAAPGKETQSENQPPAQSPKPNLATSTIAPELKTGGEIPSPGEAEGRLEAKMPQTAKTDGEGRTASQPILTLHGYVRTRGELEDTFWLGRKVPSDEAQQEPFSRFRPMERRSNCGSDCNVSTLQFANMRLRLAPQLNISEDVRVKMMFDLLDNMVAGSTPVSYYGTTNSGIQVFSSSLNPPDLYENKYNNDLGHSVLVRAAWGEVRNRTLGELRFGRMPNHWGLGMMNNAGDQLDDDFSSTIDRLMAITKLIGIYFSASYDFIGEGYLKPNDSTGLVSDVAQIDDVDQFSFTISRRLDAEKEASLLEQGDVALNGGLYFSYRRQGFYTDLTKSLGSDGTVTETATLNKLDAEAFTVDGYGELKWEGLRLGYEAALVAGDIGDLKTSSTNDKLDILQFGTALEAEYRLLNEKLGIHFDTGFASGDGDVTGLSSVNNFVDQSSNNKTVSTFRFNPAYRIDLILWRSIMRGITGAYYFRPGVNYDFIRNAFGELFGARLNLIWSRAAVPKQTWGHDPDLGVEINVSVYWRSEDGPEIWDGFHAMLQWGILVPLQGLGYTSQYKKDNQVELVTYKDLEIANALRLVLGIVF